MQTDAPRSDAAAAVRKSVESQKFTITMESTGEYEFRVRFDKDSYGALTMDEPPPLGQDKGPNASRILAAAVGNCLSASLLFCARKARVNIQGVRTEAQVDYMRNAEGRLRIGKINVAVHPQFDPADLPKAQRCLELFEDYFVVTQSVRAGIDVSVTVIPPDPC